MRIFVSLSAKEGIVKGSRVAVRQGSDYWIATVTRKGATDASVQYDEGTKGSTSLRSMTHLPDGFKQTKKPLTKEQIEAIKAKAQKAAKAEPAPAKTRGTRAAKAEPAKTSTRAAKAEPAKTSTRATKVKVEAVKETPSATKVSTKSGNGKLSDKEAASIFKTVFGRDLEQTYWNKIDTLYVRDGKGGTIDVPTKAIQIPGTVSDLLKGIRAQKNWEPLPTKNDPGLSRDAVYLFRDKTSGAYIQVKADMNGGRGGVKVGNSGTATLFKEPPDKRWLDARLSDEESAKQTADARKEKRAAKRDSNAKWNENKANWTKLNPSALDGVKENLSKSDTSEIRSKMFEVLTKQTGYFNEFNQMLHQKSRSGRFSDTMGMHVDPSLKPELVEKAYNNCVDSLKQIGEKAGLKVTQDGTKITFKSSKGEQSYNLTMSKFANRASSGYIRLEPI